MTEPFNVYHELISKYRVGLGRLEKRNVMFGWLRFLSLGLAVLSCWWVFTTGSFIFLTVTGFFIALFLIILSKHVSNNDAIKNIERLIQINESELKTLDHHYAHLPDGAEFKPEHLDYANDLRSVVSLLAQI